MIRTCSLEAEVAQTEFSFKDICTHWFSIQHESLHFILASFQSFYFVSCHGFNFFVF